LKIARTFVLSTLASTMVLAQAVPPAPPAPEPASPAVPAPATNPADAAAAKDALLKYNAAVDKGDVAALIDCIDISTDLQKQALQVMGKLTTASHSLYDATLEKFGEKKLADEGVNKEAFAGAFPALPVDQIQIKVEGGKGVLSTPDGQPLPFTLVKKGDAWKIDGSFLPQFTEQQLKEQTAILDGVIKAFDQTKADVNAGHIQSPDEVLILMQHRAQKSVRAAQMAQMQAAAEAAATQPAGAGPTTVPADIMAP